MHTHSLSCCSLYSGQLLKSYPGCGYFRTFCLLSKTVREGSEQVFLIPFFFKPWRNYSRESCYINIFPVCSGLNQANTYPSVFTVNQSTISVGISFHSCTNKMFQNQLHPSLLSSCFNTPQVLIAELSYTLMLSISPTPRATILLKTISACPKLFLVFL